MCVCVMYNVLSTVRAELKLPEVNFYGTTLLHCTFVKESSCVRRVLQELETKNIAQIIIFFILPALFSA